MICCACGGGASGRDDVVSLRSAATTRRDAVLTSQSQTRTRRRIQWTRRPEDRQCCDCDLATCGCSCCRRRTRTASSVASHPCNNSATELLRFTLLHFINVCICHRILLLNNYCFVLCILWVAFSTKRKLYCKAVRPEAAALESRTESPRA